MKKLTTYLLAGLFIFFTASPVLATATASPVAAGANCEKTILGIPPWYRGLTNDDCTIVSPERDNPNGLRNFIWRIVLNVIQIGLIIAAYVAFFFIVYGGFMFITGGSNPAQVEKGRKSIFNAVIGLVIALGAVAITNFIFGIVAPAGNVGSLEGVVQMSDADLVRNILNTVYFAAGTVAVVVIIIAGIMYTTAAGDSGRINKAKNMLTYSIAGLVIVLLAFAITSFVVERFV